MGAKLVMRCLEQLYFLVNHYGSRRKKMSHQVGYYELTVMKKIFEYTD